MIALDIVDATQKKMVEAFQCPGCVCGMDIECGAFKLEVEDTLFRCGGHVPGTTIGHVGQVILGLPNGFNRLGPQARTEGPKMRLWPKGNNPTWDKFNIAVWAMERDGYLFVRTFMPRVNYPMIDVIEGGTLDMCPGAVNVGAFYDEMD